MNEIKQQLPFESYKQHEGVNASILVEMLKSPRHARHYMLHGRPKTPAMVKGSLVHSFILEPETAFEGLVVRPEGVDFRTAAGKEWRSKNEHNQIITQKEKDDILGMCKSVREHPDAARLLAGGEPEVSLFADWNGRLTRKCRIDWMPPGNVLADLKTCQDASERGFSKQIANLNYHVRAGYYWKIANDLGIKKDVFQYIAVESEAPYNCEVYQLDYADLRLGASIAETLLERFALCIETGEWPGYGFPETRFIQLPEWARKGI